MKIRYLASLTVLVALVFPGCKMSGYRDVPQYTIEQFMNTTTIFGSCFSHDEEYMAFTSDRSGVFNAYMIPIEGGEAEQISHSDSNSVFVLSFFPDDDRMLLLSDQAGNEIWHIYLREEDGTVRDLTPYEGARSTFYDWSYDEESFFFGCNKRNPRMIDLYEMSIETFEPKMIYRNDEGYFYRGMSNDERYMVFQKVITEHNSDMYLFDRETHELKHLTPHEGDINHLPMTFSVDSKSLYYLTDEGSEFTYLKRYDIESRGSEIIEEEDWDILYAYFSRNGKYRVVGINNNAKTEIKIHDMESDRQVDLPVLPEADITSINISKSEKLMAFYVNGSRCPNNLYVYDFITRRHRRITDSMNPEMNSEDLVDAELVSYKSFDGLEIPALLYKPLQIKQGDKAPALVWVHGGPGGQSRVGYNGSLQYLVNHGYVVLAVNNRGSSGYGKTFFKLDDQRHGEDDLGDCVEAKKSLASTGYVDPEKIGIIGGSYGGYIVLAALAFRPEEFAVGVDLFGISNWVRTLRSIPPWWEAFKEALYREIGDPETDEERLYRISPLFHAKNIRKPLIVLQGANDPRVHKVESDEIVEAVIEEGVPVEYVVFDDEGHGFRRKENRMIGYKAILDFLDKHLKGNRES